MRLNKAISLITFLIFLVSIQGQANNQPTRKEIALTKKTLIEAYFTQSEDIKRNKPIISIWEIEFAENDADCDSTTTGFFKEKQRFGSAIFRFWICLKKNSQGKPEGELLDVVQVADE